MEQLGISPSYMYHVYTEYHASQIEMMIELGCSSVFSVIEKDLDCKSIRTKLLNERADFSNRVISLNLSKTNDFSKAMDWFCYYIGKANVFLHYYNTFNDVLLDLQVFSDLFGNEIILLQKELFRCNTTNVTINDILNIANKHLILVKKFKPH